MQSYLVEVVSVIGTRPKDDNQVKEDLISVTAGDIARAPQGAQVLKHHPASGDDRGEVDVGRHGDIYMAARV